MDLAEAISRYLASFGRKPDSDVIVAYALVLHGLTDEQLAISFNAAVRKDRDHPLSAGQLRALAECGGVSYEARAEVAFEELERALDANKPSLMSPLTRAVARQIGGFQRLYAMSLDDFKTWKRKDFLATYTTMAKENPDRLAAIAGPKSELAKSLAAPLKTLPSREEVAAEETTNRERLKSLT